MAALGRHSEFTVGDDDDEDDKYAREFSSVTVDHSLPVPEQVRTESVIAAHRKQQEEDSRSAFKKNRRNSLLLFVSAILAFFAIFGFMVAFLTRGERKSKQSAIHIDQGRHNDIDKDIWAQVIAILETYTPNEKLQTLGRPQNEAANFVARQVMQGLYPIPPSRDYDDAFSFVQTYAVATFYHATDGPNSWVNDLKFLSDESVCNWNQKMNVDPATFVVVEADEQGNMPVTFDTFVGVRCNDANEVNYITIPNNGLVGELPPEMGLFEALETFSVYENQLSGTLPNSLKYWNDIEVLILEYNQFSGPLPQELVSGWTWLETASFSHNSFAGDLPSFGDNVHLKSIALNNNAFTGSLDVFNQAWALQVLFLQNNQMTGPFNPALMIGIPISLMDVSNNQITGQLSSHFYNVDILDAHNNQISGVLPPVDGTDYAIKFMSLYNNQIIGDIPQNIGDLKELNYVDLSGNGHTGKIPDSFNNLGQLKYLYLNENNFDKQFMPYLADCAQLQELSLRNCNLDDQIPDWIGNWMNNLVLLDLSYNQLHGEIVNSLAWVVTLRFLLLSHNNLSGSVPNDFWDFRDLNILTLDHNPSLSGSIGDICNADGPQELEHVLTDCSVQCTCCDKCCDGNNVCGDETTAPHLDGSYERDSFIFSQSLIFDGIIN